MRKQGPSRRTLRQAEEEEEGRVRLCQLRNKLFRKKLARVKSAERKYYLKVDKKFDFLGFLIDIPEMLLHLQHSSSSLRFNPKGKGVRARSRQVVVFTVSK